MKHEMTTQTATDTRMPIEGPGHHLLSGNPRYCGLVEIDAIGDLKQYRLQFCNGPATILDIVVTADVLGDMARSLVPPYGTLLTT